MVPATLVSQLLTWTEGQSREVAQCSGVAAKAKLKQLGARVLSVHVGDPSPLLAIEDHLRDNPDYYDALIICTFPPAVSRWLRLDLPHRAERKFGLPVIHIVAQPPIAAEARAVGAGHNRPGP